MVAFSIFGFAVYWYGLIYLLGFIVWYTFLWLVWKSRMFEKFAWTQKLLTTHLDDFFIVIMLGVLIWWRLWHVFLYDWRYFSDHLIEIFYVRDGWMSIIGWILWVTIWSILLARRLWVTTQELLIISDLLLCVTPFGVLVWRIGNFLNQELIWKPIEEVAISYVELFERLRLVHIYDTVDLKPRVNTNFIQSWLEWWVTLIVSSITFAIQYVRKRFYPWLITWLFLCFYAAWRFWVEYFKDLPPTEMYGSLTVSQWSMVWFAAWWLRLILRWATRPYFPIEGKTTTLQ